MTQYIIAALIICAAAYGLYRSLRRKGDGDCCDSKCAGCPIADGCHKKPHNTHHR